MTARGYPARPLVLAAAALAVLAGVGTARALPAPHRPTLSASVFHLAGRESSSRAAADTLPIYDEASVDEAPVPASPAASIPPARSPRPACSGRSCGPARG